MNEHPCIIVPLSEREHFVEQVMKLPAAQVLDIQEKYRMLVVPDEVYHRVRKAHAAGELKDVLSGGAKALEHWLRLGQNTIGKSTGKSEIGDLSFIGG